jgi:non-ribosomal peptide synthetase component F
MTLLAAFQALLGRYSGQEDLVVGSPIANRPRVEFECLLGCFINFLVLRADLSGDPPFRRLLGQVREYCLQAYANQDYPFARLVDDLDPAPDPARHPLFHVMFEVISDPRRTRPELAGLALRPLDFDYGTSEFDLSLILQHEREELSGWLLYKTALFEAATARAIGENYQQLLEAVLADPDARLSALPVSLRLR